MQYPLSYLVGLCVTIQLTVDVLAASLGSASRDNDAEGVGFHDINDFHKAVDKGGADGAHLHGAGDNGKDGLLLALVVLFGVNSPLVNRERKPLFNVLHSLAFGDSQFVYGFLVVDVDVCSDDVHWFPFWH